MLDFYDPVQGRKNPAMICRCLKTGIGGKSGDHHTISKACDAAISKIWGLNLMGLQKVRAHTIEGINLNGCIESATVKQNTFIGTIINGFIIMLVF